MTRENIPRWMTQQQTLSIGGSNQGIRVVTPDDLEMASKMYGQVSSQMFEIANQLGMHLNYIHPQYEAMKSQESIINADEALEKLRYDPIASKDGPSYRRAAEPIMQKATEGMGYIEGSMARRLLNTRIAEHSLRIGESQLKTADAEIMVHKREMWDNKNRIYLSQVNNTWSPEEKKKFIDNANTDRRETMPWMSEEQHKVLDDKFSKHYEAASLANQLFRDNAFAVPKLRDKILESKEFTELEKDPEKLEIVNELINHGLKVYNNKSINEDKLDNMAILSAFNNFSSAYDRIQSSSGKKDFYYREKQKSKELSTSYQKKIEGFGFMQGYEMLSSPITGSKSQNDLYYNMGIRGDKDLSEIIDLAKKGLINSGQVSAFRNGANIRNKEYEIYDNPFYEQVKADFGFSLKAPKGKNAIFLDQLPKDPMEVELKNFILEKKAAISMLSGVEYKQELSNIIILAKQKRDEMVKAKQSSYGNQDESVILTTDYGNR
jgi:hypothetical protein